MNRFSSAGLALLLLSAPAGAVTLQDVQNAYDQFTVEEPAKPLDELVPEDKDDVPLKPAEAAPVTAEPPQAGQPPQAAQPAAPEPPQTAQPATSEPAATPAPAAEQAGGPVQIASAPAPDDWQTVTLGTYSFALPADFAKVEADSEHVTYFKGDMNTHEGIAVMVLIGSGSETEPPPGKSIAMSDIVLPDGTQMTRRSIEMQLDPKVHAQGIMLLSSKPVREDDHLLISEMGLNRQLGDYGDLFDTILATFKSEAPANIAGGEAETDPISALDGLVTAPPQPDWRVTPTSDDLTFIPKGIYGGYVQIAKGEAVTGSQGLLSTIPAGTPESKAIVFDQFATTYEWDGTSRDFQRGSALVTGRVRVTLLADCLPSDERVAILVTGLPEFMDGDAVKALFSAISFRMPAESAACPAAGGAPVVAEPGPAEPVAAAPQPGSDAGQVQPQPAPDVTPQPPTKPEPAPPATPTPAPVAMGAYGVQGVTFSVPADWIVKHSAPGDLQLESADGRFTLMAFWWFPDEPLLGYDDIVSVDNIVIDHEPATRITSKFPDRSTVQHVTERARADKKRFIFTVEGAGDLDGDMQMLVDHLTGSLHWHAGFAAGASKKPTGLIGAPPAGGEPAPPTAQPDGTGAASGQGQGVTIDFSGGGTGGWTAENGTLSNPGRGGPGGGGYLKAFTPADGRTGYFIAPKSLAGDWSGYSGLRVVMTTGSGEYYEPYSYGGRGDIAISNGKMRASTAFDLPVGPGWNEHVVSFADQTRWRLDGGASTLADVLAHVTGLAIRSEYLVGDAESGLAQLDLLAGANASGAGAAVADEGPTQDDPDTIAPGADGWSVYINARFGTAIEFPASQFVPMEPPANGDGRTFQSPDGRAQFFVFGQYNALGLGFAELMAFDRENGGYASVTYQRKGPGWYVLSGYKGSDIFYRKVLVLDGGELLRAFEITYPKSLKSTFDPIVVRMAASLGPKR